MDSSGRRPTRSNNRCTEGCGNESLIHLATYMLGMEKTTTHDGEHVCEACGKAFESEAELDRHVHEVGLID